MQEQILNDLIFLKTDGSAANHQKCINYIKSYLKKVAPQSLLQLIPANNKDNMIVGMNVKELKNINNGLMLCGHLDVVAGKSQQFKPYSDGHKIYGRGAADMKGSIACYLEMIPYFNLLKLPVILCFTCDEETDMQGIKNVCAFLKKNNIHPQLTILGEPTENKLGIASSGIKSYKTVIQGVSAHSCLPNKGINALFIAAKLTQALEDIAKKMHSKELYLNVGSITGGGNIAIIPDKAEICWGFRYMRKEDANMVLTSYRKALAEITVNYPKARVKTVKTAEFSGYFATDKKQIKKLCEKLQTEAITLSYTSEAGYLAAAGQNVYLLGCGNIKQAHSDNEFIALNDLEHYKILLRKSAEALAK